ncbi:MAG: hypothetical protein WC797_02290 [Candidatus Paceibacterota bacterium]|jgi:hypothetical protein
MNTFQTLQRALSLQKTISKRASRAEERLNRSADEAASKLAREIFKAFLSKKFRVIAELRGLSDRIITQTMPIRALNRKGGICGDIYQEIDFCASKPSDDIYLRLSSSVVNRCGSKDGAVCISLKDVKLEDFERGWDDDKCSLLENNPCGNIAHSKAGSLEAFSIALAQATIRTAVSVLENPRVVPYRLVLRVWKRAFSHWAESIAKFSAEPFIKKELGERARRRNERLGKGGGTPSVLSAAREVGESGDPDSD